MLYKASKFLTLVIYEDQKPTKCFEIKKTSLKLLFLLIPLLTFIGLGFGIYSMMTVKKRLLELEKERPAEIQMLADRLEKALVDKNKIKTDYDTLLNKINAPSSESALVLPFINPVKGYKDLRGKKLLEMNNFRLQKTDDQITCTFDIMNKVEPEKTSGYVFAVLKAGSTLEVFPKGILSFDGSLTSFDQGERFTVTRFRPFTAKFTPPKNVSQFSLKIYIFSRHGDLLLLEEKGPINRN